jgi:hypothetical protein
MNSEPTPPGAEADPAPEAESTPPPTTGATERAIEPAASDDAPLRISRAALIFTLLTSATVFIATILSRFHIDPIWDDAFMFQRYAYRLLVDHRVAWNPGGEPTYGLTSPLFLLVGVPLRVLSRGNQALAVMLSSSLCAVAFVAAWVWLLYRGVTASPGAKKVALVVTAYCLATSTLVDHAASGMETTFVILYATLYLLAATTAAQAATKRRAIVTGLVGGLSFSVRPELAMYTLLVPFALALLGKQPETKRLGRIALPITAGLIALNLLVNRVYFGTALPLPFYAKSLNLYGETIRKAYRGGTTNELIGFLSAFWPLFVAIGIDALRQGRRFFRAIGPIELALLVSTTILILYHWIFVLPVMAYSSRFYYPALPGLLYLAAQAIGRIAAALPRLEIGAAARHLAAAGAMAFLWLTLVPAAFKALKECSRVGFEGRLGRLDVERHAKAEGPLKYWYKLDDVSRLPNDVVIASTEVGMLGVLVLDKTLIDLAGLHEKSLALAPLSGDRFFEQYKPDWIYMPHPDYAPMIESMRSSKAFAGYEEYKHTTLGTKFFGVAIRKDSRHYAALKALVTKPAAPQMTRSPAIAPQ